ncbi:MAG: hypothetical protein GYB26_10170 [Gammaproteobacteria bacterium]|nr:hypothetical protein [Gammaproteobacteria bacterium]
MIRFKKFPQAAYRDGCYEEWTEKHCGESHMAAFLDFLQGQSLAVCVPSDFFQEYYSDFTDLCPFNAFRDKAHMLGVSPDPYHSLNQEELKTTIQKLYSEWLSQEVEELERRAKAVGLRIAGKAA